MPKFFVNKQNITEQTITIYGKDAKHINVLRYKINDIIEVCDGENINYNVLITDIKKDIVTTKILEKYEGLTEPKIKITLFQALPKNDKMELIIQKCVELGVQKIVPVITENAVFKPNNNINKKIDRWQKISETAAKQSQRGIIPKIDSCINFNEAVKCMTSMDQSFIAYEQENKNKISEVKLSDKELNVGIFIGSEGGFTSEEVKICNDNNIISISLGSRILRTETAGFVAVTILMFMNGEL